MIEPFCYLNNNFEIISSENDSSCGYDILNRAWLLNTLLVLRGKTNINSVALLNQSWNNLNNVHDLEANLCDYHVKMLRIKRLKELKVEDVDVEWVKVHYENANDLAFKNIKFRYALEVINSCRYCVDVKSAIAILWAAIESIVDVSIEVSYRLSLSISSLLCERGDERIKKFNDIKKLYGLRSRVVHGSGLKESEIEKALVESFKLLSELVVYMIEKNKPLESSDFENAIFK